MYDVFILFKAKYYEDNKSTHVIIGSALFAITMFVWLYEEMATFKFLTKVYRSKNS